MRSLMYSTVIGALAALALILAVVPGIMAYNEKYPDLIARP
jgi:hypothetical protein